MTLHVQSLCLGLDGASVAGLRYRGPRCRMPVEELASPFLCLAAGWATSRLIARESSLCLRRVSTHAGTPGPAAGGQTPSAL